MTHMAEKHWSTIRRYLPQGVPFCIHDVALKVGPVLKVSGPTAYVYGGNALNWAHKQAGSGLERVDRSTWLYTPPGVTDQISA